MWRTFAARWVVERPKVYFNAKTKKFVMYFHFDGAFREKSPGYNIARVGVAVSDTVDGDYTFLKSFRPLGQQSRDIGQFIDDDGTAYLIFEDRLNGFRIARLSDDYLTVEMDVRLVGSGWRAERWFVTKGFFISSARNSPAGIRTQNKYATAKSLAGPWSEFKDIAPPETKTYRSNPPTC